MPDDLTPIPVGLQLQASYSDSWGDDDRYPDMVPVDQGEIQLTPVITQYTTDAADTPIVGKSMLVGTFGGDGQARWEHEVEADPRWIYVHDLTDSRINPHVESGATHRIAFRGLRARGRAVEITGGPVRITPDLIDPELGYVNLARLLPAPNATIVSTIGSTIDADRAETAADKAQAWAEDAESSAGGAHADRAEEAADAAGGASEAARSYRDEASGHATTASTARAAAEAAAIQATQAASSMDTLDQTDFVALVRSAAPTYTSARLVRTAVDQWQVRHHGGGRGAIYQFVKNTNDDFIRFDAGYTGYGTSAVTQARVTANGISGNWSSSGVNWFAREVGASFTVTVEGGSDLALRFYTDYRGGVWSLSVDGGPPTTVSTWGEFTGAPIPALFATDLDPHAQHTIVGTFQGDDPNNPPDPGPSRGWLRVDDAGTVVATAGDAAPTNPVMAPVSNKEFAFTLRKDDESNWLPEHNNLGSVFNISPPVFVVDGKPVDAAIGSSTPIQSSFELRQHFRGRVVGASTPDVVECRTTTQINAQGLLTFSGQMHALTEVEVATGYPMMLPSDLTSPQFVTGIGTTAASNGDGGSTFFSDERNAVFSGAVISPDVTDTVGAMTMLNPRTTYRRGRPPGTRPQVDRSLFLWRRATKPKVYWHSASAWTMGAGDTYAWSFQAVVADVPNAYSLIK